MTYTDLYDDASTNVSSENDMCAFQNHFYSFIQNLQKRYISENTCSVNERTRYLCIIHEHTVIDMFGLAADDF